jgi:hypothetical protein
MNKTGADFQEDLDVRNSALFNGDEREHTPVSGSAGIISTPEFFGQVLMNQVPWNGTQKDSFVND